MPRLPDFTALGQRDTGPSRRPIATIDTSAESTAIAGFGRAISGAADTVFRAAENDKAQDLQINGARADADFLTKKIEFEKQFNDEDQDYANWSTRYQEGIKKIAGGAAAQIPDPRARELWTIKRQDDIARGVAGIEQKSKRRELDYYRATGIEALENLKQTFVEAKDDEAMRMQVIQAGRGLVEDMRRRGVVNDTDAASFGKQWVENTAEAVLATLTPEERIDALRGRVTGISGVVDRIIGVESGGDPNIKARTSSATGLGQFISSTWLDMMNRYRPELVRGRSPAEVLAMRTDPQLSREMTTRYVEENAAKLKAAGVEATPRNIYLAHFLGPGAAPAIAKADPNDPISKYVPQAAIAANRSVLEGKTVGQVQAWAERKMGGAGSRADLAENIPLERRRSMLESAQNERISNMRQQAATAEFERARWVDSKQFDASEGRYTREDARNDFLAGRFKDWEEFEKVAKQYDGFQARGVSLGNFNAAMADPSFVGNKFDKSHTDMAEEGFKAMGGTMEALDTVASKMGIVPKSAAVAMRGAIFSNDPDRVAASLTVANNLMDRNATMFAGVDGKTDIETNAMAFRHYTDRLGLNAKTAAERVIKELSPEYQASVRARVKNEDVDAIIKKQLRVEDLSSMFNEGVPVFGRPAVEFAPEARASMFSDYAEVFKDYYMQTGDVAKAKDMAQQQLSKLWGVTKINGKMGGNLIRYAPEKAPAYAGIPDISDRIANHAIEVIKQETGQDVDRANLIIGPTAKGHTSRAYWAGQSPPYMLSWTDKKGIVHVLNPDPNKGFVLDANTVRQQISAERKAKLEAVTDAGVPTQEPRQITPDMAPKEKAAAERFNQSLAAPPPVTITGALKSVQESAKSADRSVTGFFKEERKKANESIDARKAEDYTQRHIKNTPELKAEFEAFEKRMMQAKTKKEEQQIGMELNDRFEQIKREYLSTVDLSKLPALHLR